MSFRGQVSAFLTALVLLLGCATTTPQQNTIEMVMKSNTGQALVLSGGRRLPGLEITDRLTGKTLRDVYGTFTWRFGTNGKYAWGGNGGAAGNWFSTGIWSVKDDALCWTLDGYDMGCRAIFEWRGILRIAKKDSGLERWGIY